MRKLLLMCVSVFLASCESMLWTSGAFRDLHIDDFDLHGGEIEILVSQDYVAYEASAVGHHSSRHEFIKGDVYSTGRIKLRSLISTGNSEIELFKVGEKADYLQGLYLSSAYPRSMLVESHSFQRCAEYKGRCRSVVLGGDPKSDNYAVLKVVLRESEGLIYIDYQADRDSQLIQISRKYQLKDGGEDYDLLVVERKAERE